MKKHYFMSGAACAVLGLALVAAPAAAQTTTTNNQESEAADQAAATAESGDDAIIVTGTLFRQTADATPSPVTVVSAEDLDKRGISTIQEGLQALAANNGPALTNSFSANGAFAGGASAVSLRGLSTNSTLVLFDGMRAAYYPLADDGSRNFVDLNTIPDDIVEKIDVLRDGASATYGADAIAGVVNIITKREFQGVSGRAEAGISSRGDAGTYRLGLTAGTGDIEEDGYNAYISGYYYKSEGLKNSKRRYPYNSDDLRGVCNTADGDETCGPNNVTNGLEDDGLLHGFGAATPFAVRARGTTQYQYLNGCGGLPSYTLTQADRDLINPNTGNPLNAAAPDVVCQEDNTLLYGNITPDVKRFGVSGRVTATLGEATEVYAEVNFMQSNVSYLGSPATIRGNAPTGIYFPRFSTSTGAGAVAPGSGILALPVYVCATGVGTATGLNTGCNATNGTLNPNNPFAAQGLTAQIIGRLPNRVSNETRNRAYRGAIGITGSIGENWDYNVGATAMHTDLERKQKGYVYIQNFLDAIARGEYNFMNPAATSQDVMDRITPDNVTNASSDLFQLQGNVSTSLMDLPGGPLQVALGGSIHYESVDAPSANSDINGPTQRYFTLNAFGTSGHRTVYSAFAEFDAPVIDMLSLNGAVRYDKYSSGQDAVSPKVGFKFTPIPQILVRGTYSRGFRIPSFGEANALPTTGYVTVSPATYNDDYLAQYGCNTGTTTTANPNGYSTCPTYITGASYGLTTLASPDLKPEKSRSFTLGAMVEPIRNVSFTVDYYNIKKTGAISNPSTAPAIEAYYNGDPIPDGFTVIADAPDINNPNALPRIAFVESTLINSDTIRVSGLDFGINADFEVTDNIRWRSSLDASYIIKLSTTFPDGTTERYDGTLGNFNLTAGSGTPKWRGTWLNSFDFGNFELNSTVNYTGGYNLSAMDQGTDYKDCGLNDGSVDCNVNKYITFDLGGRFEINDNYTFYFTALNLFDKMPPLDPVTYGAHLYNPVQGGNGILGRYFKAGVKATF